ncbi:MAG: histidine kinase [Bacteroidota bacterium]
MYLLMVVDNRQKRNITIHVIWVIAAVFTTTQLYLKTVDAGGKESWGQLFVVQLLVWSIWGFLSPLIFWLGKRFRIDRQTYYSGALLHIAFAVILVLLYLAAYAVIWNLLGVGVVRWEVFLQYFKIFFLNLFHWHFFIYMAIIGVAHAIVFQKESRERQDAAVALEKQLLLSELNTLKSQLSPHFLFNTLNNVISTVEHGKTQVASGMLSRLGNFLRCILEESKHQLIPLEQEIEYINQYLEIERFRNKQLEVVIHKKPELLQHKVPNFILQPLVENAIKHGISKLKGAKRIEIGMEKETGCLKLWVYNEGIGLKHSGKRNKEGVGLQNTRSRLAFEYNNKASFELIPVNSGVIAEILLPISQDPLF